MRWGQCVLSVLQYTSVFGKEFYDNVTFASRSVGEALKKIDSVRFTSVLDLIFLEQFQRGFFAAMSFVVHGNIAYVLPRERSVRGPSPMIRFSRASWG